MSRFTEWLRQPRSVLLLLTGSVILVLGGLVGWLYGNWLVAAIVALAMILLVLLASLVWLLVAGEKTERRERGIDDEERAAESQDRGAQQLSVKELEAAFQTGVEGLRASRMGREAVENLPWFLLIGPEQSGKSSLLRNSQLELPAEYAQAAARGGSLSWWFTNDGVFLDTAGRFFAEEDPESLALWRRLLSLIRRTRSKVPLNGVLMCVPAVWFLESDQAEREKTAQAVRRRLNDLFDDLGVEVPVYLVAAKADALNGFSDLAASLPPSRTNEAFGWTNSQRDLVDAGDRVAEGFLGLSRRIEIALPEILLRTAGADQRRRLQFASGELKELSGALTTFVAKAFAPTVYEETPFLRGVYLTGSPSGEQLRSPLSAQLGAPMIPDSAASPAERKPAFVADLFREIIVGDQDLALPRHRFGPKTRALFTTLLWTSGALLLLGWITGFSQVWFTTEKLRDATRAALVPNPTLAPLQALREEIKASEEVEWARQVGFGSPLGVAENRAKHSFTAKFGSQFEAPAKVRLIEAARRYDDNSLAAVATLALDLSWLTADRPSDDSIRPDIAEFASLGANTDDRARFAAAYDDFVAWLPDRERAKRHARESDALSDVASTLLDLRRLESWGGKGIHYEDFSLPAAPEATWVPAAYTREAWEALVSRLIAGVGKSQGQSSRQLDAFRVSYLERYDERWRRFLLEAPNFERARRDISGSPHLRLLETIHHNIRADLPRTGRPPTWNETLHEVRRSSASFEGTPDENSEVQPWDRYLAALAVVQAEVARAEANSAEAVAVARRLAGDRETGFRRALEVVDEIVPVGSDARAAEKIREILKLPILDGMSAVLLDAQGEIDRRWQESIVVPFGGDLDEDRIRRLYAPETGELARFMDRELGSFLDAGERKPLLGGRGYDFGASFLSWVNEAEELRSLLYRSGGAPITVTLDGVPASLSGGFGAFVSRQELTIHCPDGPTTFVYRSGAGSETFRWSPACDEVELKVWVLESGGDERALHPVSKAGSLALPAFFQAARRNGRTYEWVVSDPRNEVEVIARYRLRRGEEVLRIAHSGPPQSTRD